MMMNMRLIAGVPTALSREECDALASFAKGRTVLELGSQYGASAICLASTAKIVHAVDWHFGGKGAGFADTLGEMMDNVVAANLREHIIFHVGRFEDVTPLFKDKSFDVVFVDGCHDSESVMIDAWEAMRLVRDDGHILFHDLGRDTTPGVLQGVSLAGLGRPHKVIGTLGVYSMAGVT